MGLQLGCREDEVQQGTNRHLQPGLHFWTVLLLAARNVVARRRLAGRMIPVCTSALFILHLVIMVNVNV